MKRNLTIGLAVVASLGLFLLPFAATHACNDTACKHHKNHKHHEHGKHGKHKHHTKAQHPNQLIRAYGQLRKALAADDIKVAKSASHRLASRALVAKKNQKGKLRGVLNQLASAATSLAKSKDIAAARMAFGQASRHLIAYLMAHPKHAVGITVYQCPMAKGYQKWAQWKSSMGNPYMGKSMLTCGGKTKLAP